MNPKIKNTSLYNRKSVSGRNDLKCSIRAVIAIIALAKCIFASLAIILEIMCSGVKCFFMQINCYVLTKIETTKPKFIQFSRDDVALNGGDALSFSRKSRTYVLLATDIVIYELSHLILFSFSAFI